eukprot:377070_1
MFSVHVRNGKTRAVLRNVSGLAEPGKFMAILGPSGAGKRSLKSVLVGRFHTRSGQTKVTGEILINGHRVSSKTFQKHTSYIMQDVCLFETLTPVESLRFSANLRLPSFISAEEKELRVQRILKQSAKFPILASRRFAHLWSTFKERASRV